MVSCCLVTSCCSHTCRITEADAPPGLVHAEGASAAATAAAAIAAAVHTCIEASPVASIVARGNGSLFTAMADGAVSPVWGCGEGLHAWQQGFDEDRCCRSGLDA